MPHDEVWIFFPHNRPKKFSPDVSRLENDENFFRTFPDYLGTLSEKLYNCVHFLNHA